MAEVAHLLEEGFLGSRAVLAGGMAMRLRGSARLTMLDTDLSATSTEQISVVDLRDVLEVQEEEITIVPERIEAKVELVKAFPVRFTFARPPAPLGRRDSVFKVDLSARGLALDPEWLPLRHDYPFTLGIEGVNVPTMHLVEQTAEKAVAFGIFKPAKHYADLAFLAERYRGELETDPELLQALAQEKFAGNRERFPRLLGEQQVTDFGSLATAFRADYHLRTIKAQWRSEVAYLGAPDVQHSFEQAKELVDAVVVPLLFPAG